MLKKVMLLLFLVTFVRAEALIQELVTPVTQQDGDTISTAQVSIGVCPGTSCPTILSAPATYFTNGVTTSYPQRRRVIVNTSGFNVFIGSNTTTLSTTGFLMIPSSTTYFITYNNATFYAVATTTGTVQVISETNLVP